jgi:signal transduction histidine kinase/Na+/proline symporter
MLAGTLPYLALQIRAVTETIRVLTQEAAPKPLAFSFCVVLILFAILFGARHITPREKHEGLVVAIAFESLVKLIALMMVGLFAVFGVFGGFGGMERWLDANPQALENLYRPVREGAWTTLLFLAFGAAFLLPRQFHMAFTENINPRSLRIAAWGFPLFLLLLNLPIPFILWAGQTVAAGTDPDYYVLGITLNGGSHALTVFALLGGVSAASAMMIVATVALSAMALNHLVLPASIPDPTLNLYHWLLWGRRVVIAIIVLAGYGFYVALEHNQRLVELGLISFVAVAQFLPGIVGVLYWDAANRNGFMAGLAGGAFVWFVTLFVPLIDQGGQTHTGFSMQPWLDYTGMDKWTFVTFWSLAVNGALFVVVSLSTKRSPDEADAASACINETFLPRGGVLEVSSAREFTEQLSRLIGHDMARKEVELALKDLGLPPDETNPSNLHRLRDRIERNLSGLLGPELARSVVNQQLRMDSRTQNLFADSIRIIEERLETSQMRLRGLLGELDSLRRYHRQVLEKLPLGVCSVGPDQEIIIWNNAMSELSRIKPAEVVGRNLPDLPAPWGELLSQFLAGKRAELTKVHTKVEGASRWLNLHKAYLDRLPGVIATPDRKESSGTVLLVEDMTDERELEAELAHADRLASLGRLAAGVAHEIGNPVTGIACLAQNLRDESTEPEVKQNVSQILEQTKRINTIVRSLVSFSHGGQELESKSPVNLNECAEEAIQLVKLSHSGRKTECVNRCDPGTHVLGIRQKLLQVFVNLLTNACQASGDDDRVTITTEMEDGWVEVKVRDQGSGIDPANMDRVFDPFFTTKEPGQGTGLGLPLVYNIVKDHDGHIDISSPDTGGTVVRLRFPLVDIDKSGRAPSAQTEAIQP